MALDLVTAEMLVRLIDNALGYPAYLADARAGAWVPELEAVRANIRKNLAGGTPSVTLKEAQTEANAKDKVHDRRHRKVNRLIQAYVEDERSAVAAAADLVLRLLYADGLTFINHAFDVEVAYGEKFEERARRADVQAALGVLATPLPELVSDLAGIATATTDLRDALKKVRTARLDQVGNPLSPELFAARRDGIEAWATFARVVEKVHKGDAPAQRAAREALIGDWKRLIAVTSGEPAVDEPTAPVIANPTSPAPVADA